MKSLNFFTIVLAFIAVTVISSCKKDEKCTAGTGGNLTLVVYPKHHGASIWSQGDYRDTVMVKFNTQEFPGSNPSNYDLVLVGDSGEDHVHVEGITCGDYYIYALGWDTTLAPPDTIVRGGLPFSTDNSSGEIILNVPVVE